MSINFIVQYNGGFLPDILLLTQAPISVSFDDTIIVYYHYPLKYILLCLLFLKKNQNAPRPFEHLLVGGEKMSKRLGGIKGCKYKTSSWHLNRFPDGNNIGLTVKCRGEAQRYIVHLH